MLRRHCSCPIRVLNQLSESKCASKCKNEKHSGQHHDITNLRHDECFNARVSRGIVVHQTKYSPTFYSDMIFLFVPVPESYQCIRCQAYSLPSEEELPDFVYHNDYLHRTHENN